MHMKSKNSYKPVPNSIRESHPPCATFDQLAAHLKLSRNQLLALVMKYPLHWPKPVIKARNYGPLIHYYERKELGIWWKYVQTQIKQESKS